MTTPPSDAATMTQPQSNGDDSEPDVCTLVKADLEARIAKGVETYGQRLRTNNGRDPLVDAYQECLDMSLYLRQAIEEIADLRAQLTTAQAARERAEGELAEAKQKMVDAFSHASQWAAKAGFAEGKLQGSKLAGVVRDWQERAESAEARLAKVGEIVSKTAHMLRNDSGWMSRNMEEFAWKLLAELEAALKPTT